MFETSPNYELTWPRHDVDVDPTNARLDILCPATTPHDCNQNETEHFLCLSLNSTTLYQVLRLAQTDLNSLHSQTKFCIEEM